MADKSVQTKSGKRAPVVVIMGHIDHGKSTLLDYIRKTNIVADEAGGITQRIAAYEVSHTTKDGNAGSITFLDTPGHEAFTSLRERGASVADIAVLVVSAEEGVKPQTLEALAHIKEARLPFIVAMNKIDRPNADVERTKQSLAEHEIYIEGYGGDVPAVPISALTGEGVNELLDMILLLAELSDFKAEYEGNAEGVVIESHRDTKRGISGTLIIKKGTLQAGMFVAVSGSFAPVRLIQDFLGRKIKSATVSSAVTVIGWSDIPAAGKEFKSFDTKKEAEKYAEEKVEAASGKQAGKAAEEKAEGEIEKVVVPAIIKADNVGSLEAIEHEIAKIKKDSVSIKIIQKGIGNISESDIKAASGSAGVLVIGFNSPSDPQASSLAERLNIRIDHFDIIYKLTEYIAKVLEERTPKVTIEESTGNAKVIRLFSKNKDRQVVGGRVEKGVIASGEEIKIWRRESEIGRGRIKELQTQKKRTDEVKEGFEFGAMIEAKFEIAAGDRIEGFRITESR